MPSNASCKPTTLFRPLFLRASVGLDVGVPAALTGRSRGRWETTLCAHTSMLSI